MIAAKLLLAITLAGTTSRATGQNPPPAIFPPMPVAPAAPGTMSAQGVYYEYSVSGMVKYMEALKTSNATIYEQMKPEYDHLRIKYHLAWAAPALFATAGAIMVASSISDPGEKSGTFTSGLYMIMLAPIPYFLIRPSIGDFLDFINKHNRINPSDRLHLSFGTSSKGFALAINFAP